MFVDPVTLLVVFDPCLISVDDVDFDDDGVDGVFDDDGGAASVPVDALVVLADSCRFANSVFSLCFFQP